MRSMSQSATASRNVIARLATSFRLHSSNRLARVVTLEGSVVCDVLDRARAFLSTEGRSIPREVEFIMQQAFGLDIPQTLDDVCDPKRLALIVYDMQVGIVKQIENGREITDRVLQVLNAARAARIRVFFTRHMSLPKELMGVSQFRMAMAWNG